MRKVRKKRKKKRNEALGIQWTGHKGWVRTYRRYAREWHVFLHLDWTTTALRAYRFDILYNELHELLLNEVMLFHSCVWGLKDKILSISDNFFHSDVINHPGISATLIKQKHELLSLYVAV